MRYGNAVEHGSVALQQLMHAPILVGFKIHAEMATKFAAVQHDRIADRLTFVVVRFQRHVNIVLGVEVFGQCARIGCRFGLLRIRPYRTRENTIEGAVKS